MGLETIFGDMTSSIESTNPGAGEYLLLTLFVSGLTFVGELGLLIVILFLFLIVPVISSILFLLLSIIARLFQIGEEKKWKEITTKVIIYISMSLEALLSIYIAILSFTGFDLLYIPIYLMLITHIVSLVINIINLVITNKNKIIQNRR